jgi:hypothetical protein
MRYIHKWHTPIKIILFNHEEYVYHAPWYNPRLLPVPIEVGNGGNPGKIVNPRAAISTMDYRPRSLGCTRLQTEPAIMEN